jgi:RNA polymerase sigma-70 factor (ECF subfamily)
MDIIKEKKLGSEEHWVKKIREGDQCAFEQLFFEYFFDLCSYAMQFAKSKERAKDVVQEVFYKIWERRRQWTVHTSLKAYLFRSVRNEALNQRNRRDHQEHLKEQLAIGDKNCSPNHGSKNNEIDQKLLTQIWDIVSEMPQRRRSVFILHRKHGLTYKEIAKVLDITRKTVENHMGLALEDIRQRIDSELF